MSDKPKPVQKHIVLDMPAKRRLPKAPVSRIDALFEIREDRMAYGRKIKDAEAVLSELKKRELDIARDLAADLRKMGGASKVSGKLATFSPGLDDVYTVEDWDDFYAFIKKEDAFELLERRPSRGALNERLAEDDLPPGIKHDTKFKFSLTKLGGAKKK